MTPALREWGGPRDPRLVAVDTLVHLLQGGGVQGAQPGPAPRRHSPGPCGRQRGRTGWGVVGGLRPGLGHPVGLPLPPAPI